MKVTSIDIEDHSSGSRVVLRTDLYDDLYFHYNRKIPRANLGELALLTLLASAMLRGGTFSLPPEYKVCPALLERLALFQEIFDEWFMELQTVDIHCTPKLDTDYERATPGAVAFFSAGLDSLHTYYQERESIDTLMHCQGLDLQLWEEQRIQDTLDQCTSFAALNGVDLVVVRTNFREVINEPRGTLTHGLLLTGMAHALCPDTIFIPSSHTLLELEPWGSHPFTDPMLATASTRVIHHGARRRSVKLRALANNQEALDMLRVCNSSDKYNCCECEKCLRAMFALEALGIQSAALKPLDLAQLRRLKIYSESEATFWRDNRDLAKEENRMDLHRAAQKIVRRYEFRHAIKQLVSKA